ncbi:acetate--CoA ligase family protein [Cupriavidus necator]|uniref:CoA-binding protein n=1 Tax=Cupriavidus necator TaxID=106590 RepID=A0A367PIV1_CUPNE|nr:acetate--CoA ligase family protein [Cupriavidus necator]QQX82798.1 acetate--CoA ligase family protein [Cupriavidus necator]RCJ07463.1 CoA-binding protein [Cupriavidus necator]
MSSRKLYTHAELRRALHPRTIAVVGATPNERSFAGRSMANLRNFQGRVLLVNPRYAEVNGEVCYPSLSALPEIPDCVLIATARDTVEPIVRECGQLGVGGVVLFASGYAETGNPEKAADQARLVSIARESGVRLLGPNSIGYANYLSNALVSFTPLPGREGDLPPHAIGLVSQSGALAFALQQAANHGTAFSHVFSCGNACDIDVTDQIAYLAGDPACAAIACVFEGLSDASRILRAAEVCAEAGKPLVVYKMARGAAGAAAAMSHTGSMAGSDRAYATALREAGVVQVDTIEQLVPTTVFFAKAPRPTATGVAIVSGSGGAGIVAADEAERFGVPLPQPGDATRAVLETHIPDFGAARNPCDLTAQAANNFDSFIQCGDAVFADPAYGAAVVPLVVTGDGNGRRFQVFNDLAVKHGKMACGLWMSHWLEGPEARETEGLPRLALFRSVSHCFAALAAWQAREQWLLSRQAPAAPRVTHASVAADARSRILAAPAETLTERQAKDVLALYGVPVVGEALATSEQDAVRAAQACCYPVVLKVESPAIPHKSEAGVIRLDLKAADDVAIAYREVMANARKVTTDDRINGVLVQSQVPAGVEILVGARVDPHLGPLLVVGLGGVMVELMQDTVAAMAPCSVQQARGMLAQLRGVALLKGFRGAAGVDMDRLAEVIAALSEFAADQRDVIAEFDVNPLICTADRIVAVDALIERRNPG